VTADEIPARVFDGDGQSGASGYCLMERRRERPTLAAVITPFTLTLSN
jgi:hypothetical protein